MEYYKIIGYIYALLAVGYGTYLCITNIDYYIATINGYNRYTTTSIIKKINCYDKNSCYADVEYIVNNIKYLNNTKIPNNLKIGDKVKIKYDSIDLNNIIIYGIYNDYIYIYIIYIFLLVIFIILLWIFLIILIIYPNKYIFLIYAIIATIIITYNLYNTIYIYYNKYKYDDNKKITIGIIKIQDY